MLLSSEARMKVRNIRFRAALGTIWLTSADAGTQQRKRQNRKPDEVTGDEHMDNVQPKVRKPSHPFSIERSKLTKL
jgi:hypothetical protein